MALAGNISPQPIDIASQSRRTRTRKRNLISGDEAKAKIVERVKRFYERDMEARSEEAEANLQRKAKYRMWTEGADWPWENASDIALPDITEKSLRLQDTLYNGSLQQRPMIRAKATDDRNAEKEDTINKLIDTQWFVEDMFGESTLGDVADSFVNDPATFIFIPWVRESRPYSDAQMFGPIPANQEPTDYFGQIIQEVYPDAGSMIPTGDGWDFRVQLEEDVLMVKFYTIDGGRRVEMITEREVVVYNGPKLQHVEWEDCFYPAHAANPQAPGPSNPKGAAYFGMRFFPTMDEIVRLHKDGTYNLPTKEDIDALESMVPNTGDRPLNEQKANIAGKDLEPAKTDDEAPSHRPFTRLMVFDRYDIDGDGQDEDVIFWVLLEANLLLRVKKLTEVYPFNPPMRPIAHSCMIQVPGQMDGISMLELMEGLHDASKIVLDQTIDFGDLSRMPWGAYRPASGVNPDVMRVSPGDMIPLANPREDLNVISFQGDTASGINLFGILTQMAERLTTIGDLQLGRVPQGKSSALRSAASSQNILSQGEARPERMLRRWFLLYTMCARITHNLNRRFLPDEKKFRYAGMLNPGEDPYQTVERRELDGEFNFDFDANAFNTSLAQLQQSLNAIMGALISPIAIQAGITTPAHLYRLFRDFIKANGQKPLDYIQEPMPGADAMPITAEMAVATIMDNQLPDGWPAELGGAIEHFQKLQQFMQTPPIPLTGMQQQLFQQYLAAVQQMVMQQQQQQALAQAAGAQQGQQPGQPGRPAEQPPQDPNARAPMENNELIDETLPGAGGGANP